MTEIQAEEHLAGSLADDLLRSMPGAILWEVEAAAVRLLCASESAAGLLGYPDASWKAEEGLFKRHVHPEDWGHFLETLHLAAAEGGLHTCEHRMVRLDGATLWVQSSVQRSSRSNGLLLLSGLTVDISQVKEREHSLRKEEAHFRLLVENLREYGVFMLALDGSVASWTPGAQRLKGYRAEEAIGLPLAHFFPVEEREKGTPGRLLERAELERQADYEGWMVRKNGTRFWASLTLSAVADEQGRLQGFSNVARDLTQRKQTEQALKESEEHFRLLVESQDSGVFMVSSTGAVESWNRGAQRLEGYRAHEIIGSPMWVLFPRDVVDSGRPEQLLTEAARVGRAHYEGWLVRKGGEPFWGLLTASAVEDEHGHLRGFSILARDVTERKRTEQELRRSEEYFRLLVGSVQDYGVFMVSTQGLIQSWNQGSQRLKGYRAQEVIGTPISRFFPPEASAQRVPEQLVEQALLNGSATYEGWLLRKGGARFWGLVTLSAVEDEHGNLRGLSNVAKDLSERKRAEDALRESEERLRLLIDSVEDYAFFMMTVDGHVASWNPGAERVKGYKAEEVMGASLSLFFRPEEVKKGLPEQLIRRAVVEGRAEYEGWIVRKGGIHFWGNLILGAMRDSDGQLRGLYNVARDLTQRMRAERAMAFLSDVGTVLAGSLDYHTTLGRVAQLATREQAQACVVGMLEGALIQPVAVSHLDRGQEPLVQQGVRALPADSPVERGVAHVVRTGQPELVSDISEAGWAAEALGLREPGLLRELGVRSFMCLPLSARGKTFGAMSFLAAPGRHYVADDLLLAEELARRAALAIDNARLYEEGQTAIRMREEVLAVVSHDLRNPLGTIRAGAEQLLADKPGGDPRAMTLRTAEKIKRASDRMLYMIRDLLDFSSIEAGQLRIEAAEHDVDALVTETIQMLQASAAERGARLEKDVDASSPKVWCDHERVMQVLSNLIGNALKFTGQGGAVLVRTRAEGDRVVFSVSDTGPGIAEEDQLHVFNRYWQGGKKRSARESLGLGLAISKALIESHGGSIWVESTVGQGSTFSFALPVRRAEAESPARAEDMAQPDLDPGRE